MIAIHYYFCNSYIPENIEHMSLAEGRAIYTIAILVYHSACYYIQYCKKVHFT